MPTAMVQMTSPQRPMATAMAASTIHKQRLLTKSGDTSQVAYREGADTDGDSVEDHIDIDDDNDGILDIIEDTNGQSADALADLDVPAINTGGANTSVTGTMPDGNTFTIERVDPVTGNPVPFRQNSNTGDPLVVIGESSTNFAAGGTQPGVAGAFEMVKFDARDNPNNTPGDPLSFVITFDTPQTNPVINISGTANRIITTDVPSTLNPGAAVYLNNSGTAVVSAITNGVQIIGDHTLDAATMSLTIDGTVTSVTLTLAEYQDITTTTNNAFAGSLDNFGIVISGNTFANDADGDGILNSLDIDSDDDGITDNIEAQTTDGYIAPSGTGASITDIDGDGLDDAYDANTADTTSAASLGLTPVNTDAAGATGVIYTPDTTPDYIDTDSDGDGTADVFENGLGVAPVSPTQGDADGDGLKDAFETVIDGNANDGFVVNEGVTDPLQAEANNNGYLPDDGDAVAGSIVPLTADLNFRDAVTDNQPPVDGDETNTVPQSETTDVLAAAGLLANASDADGDPLTITGYTIDGVPGTQTVGTPVYISGVGSITIGADGGYSFTPVIGYSGAVPVITYTVDDGNGGTDTSTLSLTVDPVPTPRASGIDTDNDGIDDDIDLDDDNDGILDEDEGTFVEGESPITDLVLVLDGSNSVFFFNFLDMLESTASAIEDQSVVPHNGSVRLTVVQFATTARVELAPVIVNGSNIASIAATIRNIEYMDQGSLTHTGIDLAVSELAGLSPVSANQTMVLITDGAPENVTAATTAVTNAQAAGIDTLNVIGIGTEVDDAFNESVVFPQPADDDDGFYVKANTFAAYENALRQVVGTSVPVLVDVDSDGDGTVDRLDLDADNDGISDLTESGQDASVVDTNNDGIVDGTVLANGVPVQANGGQDPADSDGDGRDDFRDLDSDNDGIVDTVEARPTAGYVANDGDVTDNDNDGDGVIDIFDANEGAGTFGGTFTAPVDTDGDGTADFRDLDSDDDGLTDFAESGLTPGADANNDGVGDALGATLGDPDGIVNDPQAVLANEVGDTTEVAYREFTDIDNDGLSANHDLDDDNDGILDTAEGYSTEAVSFQINTFGVPTPVSAGADPADIQAGDVFVYSNIATGLDLRVGIIEKVGAASLNGGEIDVGNQGLADEYVVYDLSVVESGSVTTANLAGTSTSIVNAELFIGDLDSNGFNFSDYGGYETSVGSAPSAVSVGSQLTGLSGVGPAGSFDSYALQVFGTVNNTNSNPDFGVSLQYDNFTSGRFVHGVTGLTQPFDRGAFLSLTGTIVTTVDRDNDGIADHLDLDSDNDGISDLQSDGRHGRCPG